jgi:hypothetical protein
MAIGGARPGAGRKAGGVNRVTKEAIEQAKSGGILPLDFLLQIMRDEGADEVKRIDCAKAAAQYIHPKLSAIEADLNATVKTMPADDLSDDELAAIVKK